MTKLCENGRRLEVCCHQARYSWSYRKLKEARKYPSPKPSEGVQPYQPFDLKPLVPEL